ncbi:MAG: hypothetical protein PSY14_06835 [bacterium]|nr:hypothetical protein [bacterium]
MRKLLSIRDVAAKLNRSAKWFYENRAALYTKGFPRPVLGDSDGGRAAYDEGAIDAWLDSKMDPALRSDRQLVGQQVARQVRPYDTILQQRLEAMA